jgi:hypothetical protein
MVLLETRTVNWVHLLLSVTNPLSLVGTVLGMFGSTKLIGRIGTEFRHNGHRAPWKSFATNEKSGLVTGSKPGVREYENVTLYNTMRVGIN